MEYMVSFQFAALGMLSFITCLYLCMKRVPNRNNTLYLGLLIVSLTNLTLDIVSVIMFNNENGLLSSAVQLVNSLYFCSVILVPAAICAYVLVCGGKYYTLEGWKKIGLIIPIPVCFVLFFVFSSELYYKEGMVYSSGLAAVIAGLATVFYIVSTFWILLRIHKSITNHLRVIFFGIIAIETIASSLQFMFGSIYVFGYAIMLICAFLFFTLENPTLLIETASSLFNRQGFITVVRTLLEDQKKFGVICIHLDDYHQICSSHGIHSADEYVRGIAYDIEKMALGVVFLTSKDEICVVTKNEVEDTVEVAHQIEGMLQIPVSVGGEEYYSDYYICTFNCPENASDVDIIFENIYYSLYSNQVESEDRVIVFDRMMIERQRRRMQIQLILKEAIDNDGFVMRYQPICSAETGKIVSAEALVRLKDEETIGFIGPEEFIPIAESAGMILPLGMIVFEKVCCFIKRNNLCQKDMKFMEVNLSAVQCMQKNLSEQLFLIMDKYGIPARFINLEVTETAAVESSEMMDQNMTHIIDRGVSFSLDDYGAGYSNVQYIMSFPFSIVKLDKEMVWTYFDDTKKRAKTVVESNVRMMKELNLKIIAEGVETQEQVEKLRALGVDYLQGFFFSKPVEEAEFMKLIG